ncbi:MAG: DUF3418 domain-containing protein, partial [Planctomycetaceae bacterium]|nr:DUF3418 domain-containing protein [Planctomycetaceae bacterium]
VSQASANQRAGRCGRIGPGICIRLYSEADYQAREPFTPPEIQRVNLAAVILRTLNLQLGRLDDFPFLDPPKPTTIREGYRTLEELGAIESAAAMAPASAKSSTSANASDTGTSSAPSGSGSGDEYRLTLVGRRMAQLPVDPRISRIILAAVDEQAVPEVLIIAAALEIQDPRERPLDKQQAADEAHKQFANADSDFLTLVNLWDAWHKNRKELSGGQLRKWCHKNYLSWLRMREWMDVHRQLRDLLAESDDKTLQAAAAQHPLKDRRNDFAAIHRSLMTGLLANLGYRSGEREYTGAGGNKLSLWPGSALSGKGPKWFVAGELIETSQRFARTLARIQPEWIEPLAGHLVKREFNEPYWDSAAGNVMCFEKVTLWGLPVVPRRKVPYARVNPAEARELLIRFGLVELALLYGKTEEERESEYAQEEEELRTGHRHRLTPGLSTRTSGGPAASAADSPNRDDDRSGSSASGHSEPGWGRDFPFLQHNVDVLNDIRELQARTRRYDLLPSDDRLFEFYDQQIPADVADRDRLRRWYRQTHRSNPGVLQLDIRVFVSRTEREEGHADFPPTIPIGAMKLPLTYQLDPGRDADGVTVTVPLEGLPQLSEQRLSWLVPGLLEHKVTALIKSLPKDLRRYFVPAPDSARSITAGLKFGEGNLVTVVATALSKMSGERIRPEDFDLPSLPDHLRMNVRVVDGHGGVLTEGRDVAALRLSLVKKTDEVRTGPSPEEQQWHRTGFRSWDFADLPAIITIHRAGMEIHAFPALKDDGSSVSLTLSPTAADALAETRRGLRRLVLLAEDNRIRRQVENLPGWNQLRVQASSLKGLNLSQQLQVLLAERAWLSQKDIPRNRAAFEQFLTSGRSKLGVVVQEILQLVPEVFKQYHDTRRALEAARGPGWEQLVTGMRRQLASLIHPTFLQDTPWPWLIQFPRYLNGIRVRLDRLNSGGLAADLRMLQDFARYENRYLQRRQQAGSIQNAMLDHYGWMLEEFRISLFAPKLGTAITVSGPKLDEQWDRVL